MKFTIITLLALSGFIIAAEKSKPVKFDQLPVAVATAIQKATGGADITKLTKEKEDGVEAYEAVWMVKGRKHEVTVARNGTVIGLEEVIPLAEAPEAVRTTIKKEAGGRKVIKVEKAMEKGRTFFEAAIKAKKGTLEIEMDESGKVLEREEEDGDEDDEKK